jgi:hypothetical protein
MHNREYVCILHSYTMWNTLCFLLILKGKVAIFNNLALVAKANIV